MHCNFFYDFHSFFSSLFFYSNINIHVHIATTKGANSETLNLKMTAAELRAKLAARKKYDPKNDTVDLRKKYEIVQKL